MKFLIGQIERLCLAKSGPGADLLEQFDPKVGAQCFLHDLIISFSRTRRGYAHRFEHVLVEVDRRFSSHEGILTESKLSFKNPPCKPL